MPHPYFVPVSSSRSRTYHRSGISGSPLNSRATPLTFNLIICSFRKTYSETVFCLVFAKTALNCKWFEVLDPSPHLHSEQASVSSTRRCLHSSSRCPRQLKHVGTVSLPRTATSRTSARHAGHPHSSFHHPLSAQSTSRS